MTYPRPRLPRVFAQALLAVLVGCDAAPPDDAAGPPGGETAPSSVAESSPGSTPPSLPEPTPVAGPQAQPAVQPEAPSGARPSATGPRLALVELESTAEGPAASTLAHATVVNIGAELSMPRLLRLLAPGEDRCEPAVPVDGPIAPLSAAALGETLILDTPAGTWATLARNDVDGLTLYRAAENRAAGTGENEADADALPDPPPLPGGATLSISGDPREAALRMPVPAAPAPPAVTVTRSAGAAPVLSWSAESIEPAPEASADHVLLALTVGGQAWWCEIADDGDARLDADLLPAAADGPGLADVQITAVARIRQSATVLEPGGDAVLLRHRRAGSLGS